jgi:hypothetical protein
MTRTVQIFGIELDKAAGQQSERHRRIRRALFSKHFRHSFGENHRAGWQDLDAP